MINLFRIEPTLAQWLSAPHINGLDLVSTVANDAFQQMLSNSPAPVTNVQLVKYDLELTRILQNMLNARLPVNIRKYACVQIIRDSYTDYAELVIDWSPTYVCKNTPFHLTYH